MIESVRRPEGVEDTWPRRKRRRNSIGSKGKYGQDCIHLLKDFLLFSRTNGRTLNCLKQRILKITLFVYRKCFQILGRSLLQQSF